MTSVENKKVLVDGKVYPVHLFNTNIKKDEENEKFLKLIGKEIEAKKKAKKNKNIIKKQTITTADEIWFDILQYAILQQVSKRFISKQKLIPKPLLIKMKECKKEIKAQLQQISPHPALLDKKADEMIKDLDTDKEFLEKSKSLIKNTYKEYRTEQKYIGDDKRKDTTCLFSYENGNVKQLGEDILQDFPYFIRQKEKSICFTYNHHLQQLTWYDKGGYIDEMKRLKNFIKKGELFVGKEKNDKQINGVSWYSFAIQNDTSDLCIGSFKLFSYIVIGFVYWFPRKTNRDNWYKWLKK